MGKLTVADQWTVEELSKKMLVPSTVLRRKIAYWQTQVEIIIDSKNFPYFIYLFYHINSLDEIG